MAAVLQTNHQTGRQTGKVSGRRRCSCCPYGYHIDLDFVRYCESITNSQLMPNPSNRRNKWSMKRKRASREALLGLVDLPNLMTGSAHPIVSQDVGDDLQKAVIDFEKTLRNTSLPRGTQSYTFKDWQKYENPKYNGSLDRYQLKQVKLLTPYRDYSLENGSMSLQNGSSRVVHSEANKASAETLQLIRNQMATSLERMRELEDEIKQIPKLQDQIQELKCENAKLKKSVELKTIESTKKTVKTSDATTSSADLLNARSLGVGCSVLTRDVGFTTMPRLCTSWATQTDPVENDPSSMIGASLTEDSDISLDKIIGTPVKFKYKNAETSTDLGLADIFTESDFKANLKSKRSVDKLKMKNAETLTELVLSDIFTESDLDNRLKLYLDEKRARLINAHTLTNLSQHEIFTQVDIDEEINKCKKLHEKNVINNALTKKLLMTSIGVQAVAKVPVPEKISKGSQTFLKTVDSSVLVKPATYDSGCQAQPQTHSIGVSEDTLIFKCEKCNVKKFNVSTSSLELTLLNYKMTDKIKSNKITDTEDLTIKRDVGLNTTKMKSVSTALDTCDLPCKNCAKHQETINSLTQNKISVTSQTTPIRPSSLPVLIQRHNSMPPSQRKNILRNEESNSDSGSDDGLYTALQDSSLHSSKLDSLLTHAPKPRNYKKREPSKEMRGAMKVLNDALQQSPSGDFPKHMKTAINIIQQEWFKISSVATSNPLDVEDYLDCFEEISSTLLEYIVNMTDVTGNTAMHYAVSNGNFDVVSILLDSKVCNINKLNTAGYTCIMLVALAKVQSDTDREVVRRLFHMADVNIRAKEHGQTALMLAVSHGRIDTVEMLLESGADINIQDEDGSTALMCAAEHGYIEIVKLFLAQPDCDLSITDYDGSTALAIAMEAGNRDVGVLLYAQEHFSRGSSPYTSLKSKRAKSTTPTFKSSRPSTPHSSSKKDIDLPDHS